MVRVPRVSVKIWGIPRYTKEPRNGAGLPLRDTWLPGHTGEGKGYKGR